MGGVEGVEGVDDFLHLQQVRWQRFGEGRLIGIRSFFSAVLDGMLPNGSHVLVVALSGHVGAALEVTTSA